MESGASKLVVPAEAEAAVSIVRELRARGFVALLAGGCVRDLLLGATPKDFDVATNAVPAEITRLFRPTRLVGQAFGVVLVKRRGTWIEVATFRSDGAYSDGRHPDSVTFTDARHDAQRRDFTINGMFLDPLTGSLLDYVGGAEDLKAKRIRCIGEPRARFAEDYLRMLRAVRFAARLDFEIEPETMRAIQAWAASLRKIAPERIREELEKMLGHPRRARAFELLRDSGVLPFIWGGDADGVTGASPGAVGNWSDERFAAARRLLSNLPMDADFCAALAAILVDRPPRQLDEICRALTCSNEQREVVLWLVANARALDDPARVTLADLKRRMANPAFAALRMLVEARWCDLPEGGMWNPALSERVASIDPASIAPPPLVTGDDLIEAGVAAGPIFKRVLDELYRQQLEGQLADRESALAEMRRLVDI